MVLDKHFSTQTQKQMFKILNTKFIRSAPVVAAVWLSITAGIIIEFNRFFPDLLFHPMS